MALETSEIDRYKVDTVFYGDYVTHLRSGTWRWGLWETWTRVGHLGDGAQGSVYLEQETKTGALRAVKEVKVTSSAWNAKSLKRELLHLIAMRTHEHLFVRLFDWYEDSRFVYIAMEYFEHGDLGKYMKEFGTYVKSHAKEITRQLLEGLAALHGRNICHRDLKPQNILIASVLPIRVKLADFGISKSTEGTNLRTRIGTPSYLAPELHGYRPQNSVSGTEYTNAVDIWALGCVVHKILTSELPFTETGPSDISPDGTELCLAGSLRPTLASFSMQILHEFCQGKIDFPTHSLDQSHASECATNFIKSLLVFDPRLRVSAADALNHRWLCEFPELFSREDFPEVTMNQSKSLGLDLSIEAVDQFISEARTRQDVDISRFLGVSELGDIGSLLHNAASKGYPLILEMLLTLWDKSENSNIRWGPLMQVAISAGHSDVVRVLLASRIKSNINTYTNYSLGEELHLAVKVGHPTVIMALIEAGADLEARNEASRVALHSAAQMGHDAVVKTLLSAGAFLEAKDQYSWTALHFAAWAGHGTVIKTLVRAGADLDAKDQIFQTALHLAAQAGHGPAVKTLLTAGVFLEAACSGLWRALHFAAWAGHDTVVKTLLGAGADLEAGAYLMPGCINVALHFAAWAGHDIVVKTLLGAGASLEAKNRTSRRALHLAAQAGHDSVVKTLLAAGAFLEAKSSGSWRALHFAAWAGHDTVVKTLLEAGANIEAMDVSSWRAIHSAAQMGHDLVVKTLLGAGADIEVRNATSWTALHLAAEAGHEGVVKILLEAGADVNAKNGSHQNVRDIAIKYRYKGLVNTIEDAILREAVPSDVREMIALNIKLNQEVELR